MSGGGKLLVMLTEALRTRVFLEGGILRGIAGRSPLPVVALWGHADGLLDKQIERFPNVKFVTLEEVMARKKLTRFQKLLAEADFQADRRFGFFPLAIRFNIKYGFNTDRLKPDHGNSFYDINRIGPAPRTELFYNLMYKWSFSGFRFFHPSIKSFLREENITAAVVNNSQTPLIHPFAYTAKKLGVKLVNYVASWDHPVSKGLFATYYDMYLVQNEMMKDALVNLHGVAEKKIVITGWPQMDHYGNSGTTMDYTALLKKWGLDSSKSCVLLAGNSETNAPYEPSLFKRLLDWRDANGGENLFSIVLRPHPNDYRKKDGGRFTFLEGRKGVYIQQNSLSDIDELAALLRNAACVVCTGGTVLLDSLANNRPVVGVMYDEGAPEGFSAAIKNFTMSHYGELVESGAFYRANNFDEVISGLQNSLDNPAELADKRAAITKRFVGELDGGAARRVVDAIIGAIEN